MFYIRVKKYVFIIVSILALLALIFNVATYSYKRGFYEGQSFHTFEIASNAQSCFLYDQSNTAMGMLYIDAFMMHSQWRDRFPFQRKFLHPRNFTEAIKLHGESYRNCFKSTSVDSVMRNSIILKYKANSDGISAAKAFKYDSEAIDYLPTLGMPGDEFLLEFMRRIEQKVNAEIGGSRRTR